MRVVRRCGSELLRVVSTFRSRLLRRSVVCEKPRGSAGVALTRTGKGLASHATSTFTPKCSNLRWRSRPCAEGGDLLTLRRLSARRRFFGPFSPFALLSFTSSFSFWPFSSFRLSALRSFAKPGLSVGLFLGHLLRLVLLRWPLASPVLSGVVAVGKVEKEEDGVQKPSQAHSGCFQLWLGALKGSTQPTVPGGSKQ